MSEKKRPKGYRAPVRSIRVDDELWERARLRAAHENVTMSKVVYSLVEGYAKGMIDLPRVQIVYSQRPVAALPAE